MILCMLKDDIPDRSEEKKDEIGESANHFTNKSLLLIIEDITQQ